MPAVRSYYLSRRFVPSWQRAIRKLSSSSFPVKAIWVISLFLFAFALAASSTAPAQDEDTFTPMPLDRGFGPMKTGTPDIATEEIIKQLAARETEFQAALNHYT
jgi:hypothetical protein